MTRDNFLQGYFQSLFSCIERLLGFLNVENLVLPAAEEAESIWISKFGFTEMSEDKVCAKLSLPISCSCLANYL